MPTVEVHIVYDAASHPALIARTSDPAVLRVVREAVLREAEERADACRAIDEPVLTASEDAGLERLRRVLDALVPEEELSV